MNSYINLWRYLAEIFSQYEFIQTNILEKVKTHILCSIIFFSNIALLWDNERKYGEVGRAIDDYVAYAHCMATNTHS
jgi:hypothetical protein